MGDGDQTFSSSGQFENAEIPIETGLSENVLLAVSKRRLSAPPKYQLEWINLPGFVPVRGK
jgi:hypothetical protein